MLGQKKSSQTRDAGHTGACHVCAVFVSEVDEEKTRELMLRGVPEHCCQSYLWEQSVRDNVTENKISEQVVYHFLTTINVIQHFSEIGIVLLLTVYVPYLLS